MHGCGVEFTGKTWKLDNSMIFLIADIGQGIERLCFPVTIGIRSTSTNIC